MRKFVLPLGLPRPAIVAAATVALVVLLLSHSFGRAEPTHNYRPLLPAAALSTGCFPLPGGAELTLSHQIRTDGDFETLDGPRRQLRGQYNLVERAEAERRMIASFTAVGYAEQPRAADGVVVLAKPGESDIALTVTELPDTSAETLVRGEFTLDLPVIPAAKTDPVCSDPKSTKRWDK